MTEIRIPDNRDLMYPTLVAVRHLGGSATKSELLEKVPEFAGVSDEQLAVVFPEDSRYEGKSKVLYRITWACTHLKRIGALENSQRGVWSITPKGLRYLDADGTEEALKRAGKAESRKRRKARAAQQSDIVEENEDAIEVDEEGEEDWKGALLDVLKSMEPSAFERLSMRLVKEAGFRNVEVLGKAGDGGIDGVGVYKVSLVSFPTYFQCKRYTGSVPSRAVRDFRGAMAGRGDKGILITTGTFTREAKTEAVRDGAPPVDLIDGDELCELLREYGIGVRVQVRTVEGHHNRPSLLRRHAMRLQGAPGHRHPPLRNGETAASRPTQCSTGEGGRHQPRAIDYSGFPNSVSRYSSAIRAGR